MRISDWSSDVCSSDLAFFHHRVWRQRLDRTVLHAVAITRSRQLEQLDGSRTDVDADERRLAFCDEPHDFSPCHGRLRALRAPRPSLTDFSPIGNHSYTGPCPLRPSFSPIPPPVHHR